MDLSERITIDPNIHFGKPVIKNTRVPVELIIGKLATGMSYEQITAEYDIDKIDILAALEFAARFLSGEEIKLIA